MRSIRARLTLWYAAVLAVVLVIFCALTYLFVRHGVMQTIDASMSETARQVERTFAEEIRETRGHIDAEGFRELLAPFREAGRHVSILTDRGDLLATSDHRARVLSSKELIGKQGFVGSRDDDKRVLVAHTAFGPWLIVVVQPLEEAHETLERVIEAMFIAVPIAIVISSLIGYLLARAVLAPVAAISRKAREITAERLTERIEVRNPNDELGQLATMLNDLLSRLEQSFVAHRNFMTDASHELRTPIAVVQGETDVVLSRDRTAGEYKQSLEIVRSSVRRLSRIVTDLFFLARSDAGAYPVEKRQFHLEEAAAECIHEVRSLAQQRRVTVNHVPEGEMPIVGDEHLIQEMLVNLLNNAIRHSPEGGSVDVSLISVSDAYEIAVRNRGTGIPASAQPFIFDRFYRVGDGGGAGTGLGLSIARWIARAHAGDVVLRSSDETGSVFVVTLPKINASPPS